ncbi:MAG: metal-dependent transcriptional regulator [Leadbetterella sp.]
MPSFTEENYLKAIFHLSGKSKGQPVYTNAISEHIENSAASVTDMLKKLADKHYIDYIKYKGVQLTESGKKVAIDTIRRHRIWEVFLVDSLGFKWDEIHEIAELLEHIQSQELINKLDEFLGFPQFDPHGDPIPNREGIIPIQETIPLSQGVIGNSYRLLNVSEDSSLFLQHLNQLQITIGCILEVLEIHAYDGSMLIKLNKNQTVFASSPTAQQLMVCGV